MPGIVEHEHPELWHEHDHVHDDHRGHARKGELAPAPHRHLHRHPPLRHAHVFVIDDHHPVWPKL